MREKEIDKRRVCVVVSAAKSQGNEKLKDERMDAVGIFILFFFGFSAVFPGWIQRRRANETEGEKNKTKRNNYRFN